MSIFSDIVGAGLGINRTIGGESITYTEPGGEPITLTAKPRGGERLEERNGSATLQTDEMEWLIARDELLINGAPVRPKKGAVIEWTCRGETLTMTLLKPTGMEQCWKWADRGHSHYHVFCKLTGRA